MSSTRKHINPLRVELENPESYYSHIYNTNASLSFFQNPKSKFEAAPLVKMLINSQIFSEIRNCINNIAFGQRDDPDHSLYHQTPTDFELSHMHILKLNQNKTRYKQITPEEFKCILEGIKKTENNLNLCRNQENPCLIADSDIKKLNGAYQSHYDELKKFGFPQVKADLPKPEEKSFLIENILICRRSFVHAMNASCINTLIEHYLLPAMQQAGYSSMAQKALKISLSSLYTFIALGSLGGLPLSVCFELSNHFLERHLKPNDTTLMTRNAVYNVLYAIYTYASMSENLMLTAANIGFTVSGSAFGSALGYGIIQTLPKLRKEPIVENQPDTTTIKQPVPAGLRHRSPHRA